jgi:hypothetical protein
MLMPKANAENPMVTFTSRVESASCVNVGTVSIGVGAPAYQLPITKPLLDAQVTANPPAGCSFVKWEKVSGDYLYIVSDPNAQTITIHVDGDGTLRAVFKGGCCSVGGAVAPTNTLTVLAPYLAMIGLVTIAATVYVIKRER